ncbi:urease accessory protein UreD [Pleurocapsa sp. PCC 7319]|uniref:urease accessory protein UreD n=1 Tax=Pleurocapsa sp. PCC 7319 TaxID=118161 RepID=UPI00034929F1|nr:urease accessory protein UreD [Pleurocapsa sp. PCC 7319]
MVQNIEKVKYQNNLELIVGSNQACQTICDHQYTSFPLRLSPIFRLEGISSERAYLYLINTSPGLLAGDELNISLQLAANSQLYLTDQAATKVHPMPEINSKASVNSQIIVNANASLELVPEPIILYSESALEQNTTINLDSTARLFLTEIILPGRLAKQEYYDFDYYFNRLQVTDLKGTLLFTDAMRLMGKENPFKNNKLFAPLPIMGSAIAVLPNIDLNLLTTHIENIELANCPNIEVATTILPSGNGVLIRALANKTTELKKYFRYALNCIRAITNQSSLPHIPK